METTQSAVSDFERLGGDPKLSTIQRYARAVGVRLALRMEERLNNGEWCEVTSSTVSGSAWTSPDRARASEFRTAVPHFTAVTNDQFAISA